MKLASIFMYVSLLRLYLYEYQQTAHMPYACLLTRAATYTFMLRTSIRAILDNHLSFSELQNVLSCILKQAMLSAETGHISARNGRFGSAICEYRARGAAARL